VTASALGQQRSWDAERRRAAFIEALARVIARRVVRELDAENAKRARPGLVGAPRESENDVAAHPTP